MAIGGALHYTLRHAFRYRRVYRSDPEASLLDQWMTEAIQKQWKGDRAALPPTSELVHQAAWVLDQVPAEAQVLGVEMELRYHPRAPYELRARLDLLIEHEDGEVESVDFKTGKPRPSDLVAATIHHLVVAGNRHGLKIGGAPIRTTFLHTSQREVISAVVDPGTHRARWEKLTELAERACSPDPAEPSPGLPCSWCGYRDAYCDAWREAPSRSLHESEGATGDASAAE
jgi:hypothetical protein